MTTIKIYLSIILVAKMKTEIREFFKIESDEASFTDVGKSLKRTALENLNVFFLV